MALTSVTLTATPGDGSVLLQWTPDDDPLDRWEISRDGALYATLYEVAAVEWRDADVVNGTRYAYTVTGQTDAVASSSVDAVPNPRAVGHIDPLETGTRYVTIAEIKPLLNTNTSDTSRDDEFTQAVVAAEYAIDSYLGRSFPDPAAGAIEGIPEAVKQVALQASIAVIEHAGAPFGSSGSDDWLGAVPLEADEILRREIRRSPLLVGLRATFGVA